MKPKYYPARDCYRVIVPARESADGKKHARYFKTKEKAHEAIQGFKGRRGIENTEINEYDRAIVTVARAELGSTEQILKAIRHYRAAVLNVSNRAHLFELVAKFLERQEHEGRRPRTLDDDRQRLNKFCHALGNIDVAEITEQTLRAYIDQYAPGGNRKSHHKTVRKFIRWAHQKGYLAIDFMSRIPSMDKWGMNKEIVDIDDFRRLLFVTAGLEPIEPDDTPTVRYIGLLPYFVLGGLAGMRRAELLRDRNAQSILEWTDILWDENLIKVRDEVAKQTRAADRTRYIPLEPATREWLNLVQQNAGPVVNIWQSTHTKLTRELFKALEIDLPENGLRNSYASYAQTFRGAGDVAKACGDLEATIKRFYIQTLKPGTGKAWFDIRPSNNSKIVSMMEAV
jgi:hypothetical protein